MIQTHLNFLGGTQCCHNNYFGKNQVDTILGKVLISCIERFLESTFLESSLSVAFSKFVAYQGTILQPVDLEQNAPPPFKNINSTRQYNLENLDM